MSENSPEGHQDRDPEGRRPGSRVQSRRAAKEAQAAPRFGSRRAADPGRPPRRGDRSRLYQWLSVATAAVTVVGILTAYGFYRSLTGNLKREKITVVGDRPKRLNNALNILIVGSDVRSGANSKFGGRHVVGERTDTIILLHISPGGGKATLISFPRDSMVEMPACQAPNGTMIPAQKDQINASFNNGGINCTIDTLEELTDIRIDHFVKVDFAGFRAIVDALGGVEICLPKAIDSSKAKIKLPAGPQTVTGLQALGYVRIRDIGDGSDTSRIKRQQAFLSQVVKKATSGDLLTNPARLTSFITAALKSVTVDDALTINTMLTIAESTKGISGGKLQFITVPWRAYAPDPNRIEWTEDAALLFEAIREDKVAPTPTPTPSGSAGPATPAIKPGQVTIEVYNGTNKGGEAAIAAKTLETHGFKVTLVGDARKPDGTNQPKTQVLFPPGAEGYAKPVGDRLKSPVAPTQGKIKGKNTTVRTTPNGTPVAAVGPVVQLIIGADWQGAKVHTKLPSSVQRVTGNVNPCKVQ
ncbi:LCP family protein [Rhizohabitans arisaemae]|uniref:LCP family protein n=1 Tax=Rhizohabitans arisaemae TaxID=2720610 RepID=UPI0024B0F127|nr:LCP family protein [Rhizohabitans arisaemae]